jgi:glucose 1-dehydrogenase
VLHGRRARITGASSGIGKATAIRLAADGAAVAVNYYSEHEKSDVDAVVTQIQDAGGTALAVQADVGSEDDVQRMVATTVEAFGGLDLLANNAGIEKQIPLLQMTLADWDPVISTNLTGTFLSLRQAGKVMANAGGGSS